MKYADIHVAGYSSVYTVAKLHAVSPAHPATRNALDVALIKDALTAVHSCVSRAQSRASGVVHITSAITLVERNVTALGAMHPAPRYSLVAIFVLVCVEKTAQQFVQFAMLKS